MYEFDSNISRWRFLQETTDTNGCCVNMIAFTPMSEFNNNIYVIQANTFVDDIFDPKSHIWVFNTNTMSMQIHQSVDPWAC